MGVWVCVSSETVWFPTLIGQKQGSLAFCIGHQHQLQIKGNELRAAIQAVTDADIQNLAKTIFASEKRATVIVELEDED